MVDRLWRKRKSFDPLRRAWDLKSAHLSFETSSSPQPHSEDITTTAAVDVLADEPRRPLLISRPVDRVPRSWILSFIVLVAVYLGTCAVPRLFDQIDGQYAGAAREMIERADWLTPTQNGVPRLQKPPFVYWCEIVSLKLFGTNEFAARFPVALATVAWFVATGLVAWRAIGTSSAGVAAAMTLAAFTGTFFFCHLVMPEPFIGCFVALAFWTLLGALQEKSTVRQDRWLLGAWVFIALGAFSKGMHALLFPVVAISLTAWIKPSVRPLLRRFLLRPHGWALFLAILVPWYAAIEWRYHGFLQDHFFNEQLGPALSRRWPPDSDRVPLLIFWLEHLALFFPMTLLLPTALCSALRVYKSERKEISAEALLLVFWFLANAFGISFANVQDYYLMVAWPPVAVGIAWAVSKRKIRFKGPALFLAAFGGIGLLISFAPRFWHSHQAGVAGAGSRQVSQDTLMIVFQNLPPSARTEIIPLLCLIFGTSLVTGILVFIFDHQGRSHLGLSGFTLLMAAIFLFGARGLAIVQDDFSSARVAETINRMAEPDSILVQQGDPNENTGLFFYLHRPIYWVDGHPELEFATRRLRIGLNRYLDRAAVADKWGGQEQLFLVIRTSALNEWKIFLKDRPPVFTSVFGAETLLVNRSSR
jgi:4-amino-4-deoxy-L-arabinose transferase-like glycosyltransferase